MMTFVHAKPISPPCHPPSIPMACPPPQRYWAIVTVALGIIMAVMDSAIANVALPTIAFDLHASPALSIWIVNGYQLAITISLLPLAALGDIIGYRRVYLAGLILFTIASLLCALAPYPAAARRRARSAGLWCCRHHERELGADPLHLPAQDPGPRSLA